MGRVSAYQPLSPIQQNQANGRADRFVKFAQDSLTKAGVKATVERGPLVREERIPGMSVESIVVRTNEVANARRALTGENPSALIHGAGGNGWKPGIAGFRQVETGKFFPLLTPMGEFRIVFEKP